MRRFTTLAVLALAVSILAACSGQSGGSIPAQPQTQTGPESIYQPNSERIAAQSTRKAQAYFTVLPPRGIDFTKIDTASFAATTVPYFARKVTSPLNGTSYTAYIVGKNPATSTTTTNIKYVPIVVKWNFTSAILDPTKPGCGDTVSVENRFFKGPSFNAVALTSNGVSVGPAQINDGFQRAEFWKYVSVHTGYHTMLVPSRTTPIVLTEPATGLIYETGDCAGANHDLWEMDINTFDSIIQTIVNKYSTPTQIPLVLSYNIVEYVNSNPADCCVIGYHSAYSRSTGVQTYAIGAYTDPNLFSLPGIADIHAWTHEIGELFNDPFVNNATPKWGHIGQVHGCQSNLEVGDPLTGTPFTVTYGGFTYHPQELAFFDWFFRTPTEGTGGAYSFEGTFTTVQGQCS